MAPDSSQSTAQIGSRRALAAVVVLLGLAALCLALSPLGRAPDAAASLQEQSDAKQAELDEVRHKEGVLTTTISRFRAQIGSLEKEVAALRTREAAVEAELAAKQAELDRAVARLERGKERLRVLRRHLKRALVDLRERLVAIYKAGTPDLLGVVLNSRGFDELLNNTEYLNSIRGQDDAIIARVRELRNEMREIVRRLREAKDTIQAARDAIAAEERRLAGARAAVQSRQAELVAARAGRERALDRIGEHKHKVEGDLAEIQAEIAAQLGASASAPLPAGPVRHGSGQFIWPVNGPVVSGFGPRWGRMHEGIDVAVPAGTPIRAAASGTVALAGPMSGYGNYVCIEHGGGLATCYAHLSSFATSSGSSVGQGDVIGYVGCTGHCFGDHLHFEVRINGAATDPLGYL